MGARKLEATLDKFGRIVIPKLIRDHLGLKIGAMFRVEEQEDRLILQVIDPVSPIQIEEGVAIYTGTLVGDLESIFSIERDIRAQTIWGGS